MLTKDKPLHRQVEEYVRSRIVLGEFPSGSQLPSTSVLAKVTGTSVCTVQAALVRLTREGLLDRQANRGTYVLGDKLALASAGIYFNRPLSHPDLRFCQILGQELQRKLGQQGVKVQVWSDDREEEKQTEPLPTLKRAIERSEIQALIAPLIVKNDLSWLGEVKIPFAILTNDLSIKNGVHSDHRQMLRLGMQELRRQGCRTVGIINNMILPTNEIHSIEFDFYNYLVEIIGEVGLETRNEWIRFPAAVSRHLAQYGYEQFHSLWDLPQRPDGLLVHPDNAAHGVITAILERRVKVPRELKLAFHANDLLPYPCPLPAAFMMTKVGEFADALIETVRCQIDGRELQIMHKPVTVIQETSPFPPNLPEKAAN